MSKKDDNLQEVFSGTLSVVPSVRLSRKDLSNIKEKENSKKVPKSKSKNPVDLSLFFKKVTK